MTPDEARAVVVDVIGQIAPEADLNDVDAGEDLRDEIDLDSLDFLGLIEGIKERTGVDVPEADYPQVRSLDGVVAYVTAHAG
jgi:acyl carrier protein